MIQRVHIQGYRSLRDVELELGPVNVLIGPNASGKSNFADVFLFLQDAVKWDTEKALALRGGLGGVLFHGKSISDGFSIELDLSSDRSEMAYFIRSLEAGPWGLPVEEELKQGKTVIFSNRMRDRKARNAKTGHYESYQLDYQHLLVVKALGFLGAYPEIRDLRQLIEKWQFLAVTLDRIRAPQREERSPRLELNGSNLVSVLRTLQGNDKKSEIYDRIVENLRDLLEMVEGLSTKVNRDGLVLLQLKEKPFEVPIDILSASDGTLRLLAYLTALHTMPEHGLLCIEEPEHGLHPLVVGGLLDMIRERTEEGSRQVILTTHSPALIDAAEPEEVVVTERDEEGATTMRRLDVEKLREWLDDFRLGELWRMRQIGGVPG